jgi:hypothetical protein
MGDHRASIKIEMEFHGVKDSADMWINYWPDGEYQDVDDRVIKFIRSIYERGMANYEKARAAHAEKDQEAAERQQLARLKAKYEPPG